jgi:hypothetical protein
MVCNMVHFYGEELLAPSPTSKLEDRLLSDVISFLLNIYASQYRDRRLALVNVVMKLRVP